MPSSVANYAIDYDKDGYIDLKESKLDAIGSAANYINKIGWKKNMPCFDKVNFSKDISSKYLIIQQEISLIKKKFLIGKDRN